MVLIDDGKVALIERFRNGKHYFVFPGGGVGEGESLEEAAIREMEEENGLRVTVVCKLAEIHFGMSTQYYFQAKCCRGEFGSGTGQEYTVADPNYPAQGVHIPVWMPLSELSNHEDVYPAEIVELVLQSVEVGWPENPVVFPVRSN